MAVSGRELLIALSVKNQGDWQQIYDDVKNKIQLDEPTVRNYLSKLGKDMGIVTILDGDYPEAFKRAAEPPFVLYTFRNSGSFTGEDQTMLKELNNPSKKKYGFGGCGNNSAAFNDNNIRHFKSNNLLGMNPVITNDSYTGLNRDIKGCCSADELFVLHASGIDSNKEKNLGVPNNGLHISEYPIGVILTKATVARRNYLIGVLSDEFIAIDPVKSSPLRTTIETVRTMNKPLYILGQKAGSGVPFKDDAYVQALTNLGATLITEDTKIV